MPDADSTAPDRTTVLGAAQYIATLMDGSEPSDTPPPSEATPEEQPEAPPADDAAVTDPPADADEEKTDESEHPEPKPKEPAPSDLKDEDVVFTIEVDGTETPVTRAEARKGHLRQADYTRKTQQLAEQRRTIEAQSQEVATKLEQYSKRLEQMDDVLARADVKEPNWEEVKRLDPEGFADRVAEWQVTKSRLDAFTAEKAKVREELEKQQAAAIKAVVDAEAQALVAARPELTDPAEYQKFGERLMSSAERMGFTREEVAGTVDHRLLLLLDKAAQFDAVTKELETLKKRPASAPPAKGPKILPPGSAADVAVPGDKTKKEALARVGKTGRFDDGVAAIRALG